MRIFDGTLLGLNFSEDERVDVALFIGYDKPCILISAVIDPDDGYRSYTSFDIIECEFEDIVKRMAVDKYLTFENSPIDVVVTVDTPEDCVYERFTVTEVGGETFLSVYTDEYDNYYPIGVIEYTPNLLKINNLN